MPSHRRAALGELTTQLEAVALRALAYSYDEINHTYFHGKLARPILEFGDTHHRLGCWSREHRTLQVARPLLLEAGWGVILEVLKHEMAHQFVDEVLGCSGDAAHGNTFREVCRERGFDQRAAGMPKPAAESQQDRLLGRVAKLLALAQSPDEHEAHAAALAAQRMMLKYNLEQVAGGEQRLHSFRHLGKPSGRIGEAERILARILGDNFFVKVIWVPVWRPLEGKRGQVLEACGTPENLELAEYTHSFLLHTAERLWQEHKRRHGIKGNAERRSYRAGVMAGFRDQLRQQKAQHREQGLVWVGDSRLDEFFRQRHPRIRWSRHACSQYTEAYAQGRDAGRRVVLHRAVTEGPSAGPHLLASKGS